MICAVPETGLGDSWNEFALRRDLAFERQHAGDNDYELLRSFLAENATIIIDMETLTTDSGLAKQVPVVEAYSPPNKGAIRLCVAMIQPGNTLEFE